MFIRWFLLLLPIALFANEGGTDIVPRSINFLIFAAILYRFIAEPLRNFFEGRREEIVSTLKSIEKKVEESKKAKEEATLELEKAKEFANELIEDTKKEIDLITKRLHQELENELKLLEKYHEERKEIERRKMVKSVVSETIDKLFSKELQSFDNKELVNIVMKKVA